MVSEVERVLLGALIFSPGLLEQTDISISDFRDPRAQTLFGLITEVWEERRPTEIDLAILADRLKDNGMVTFLSSCLNGNLKLDKAAFLNRLIELRKKNQLQKIYSIIYEQTRTGELRLEELEPEIQKFKSLQKKN